MLNLAREDVYEYLYNSLYKLLDENNIKFIKWDMNKSLTRIYNRKRQAAITQELAEIVAGADAIK